MLRIRIKVISWIRISIKVISWIRIRIRTNLQMTSRNVWNMILFEDFFEVLSIYFEDKIRIRIKVKHRIRIRIRIKVRSRIQIRIKVTSRIRIRIKVMQMRSIVGYYVQR